MMFGYACDETATRCPPHLLGTSSTFAAAHQEQDSLVNLPPGRHEPRFLLNTRTAGRAHQQRAVVSAAPPAPVRRILAETVAPVRPIMKLRLLTEKDCEIFINTTGRFVVGGYRLASAHRSDIQDTYGGSSYWQRGSPAGPQRLTVRRHGHATFTKTSWHADAPWCEI